MLTQTHPVLAHAAGPLLPYLLNPDVMEIRVSPTGACFVRTLGAGKVQVDPIAAETLDDFLAIVASLAKKEWREVHPRLSAADPKLGFRIQASRPPVAPGIQMVLRKHPSKVFPLDDFIAKEVMTQRQCTLIQDAITRGDTVMLTGPTFSAKTSLLNAFLEWLKDSGKHICICEDQPELLCSAPDIWYEHCVDEDSGQQPITMYDLCKGLLRVSPEIAVVGEFRDGAALDAMKLFATGHQGLCTVHADSAVEGLMRLEELILEVSETPQQRLIGRAIDFIVHLEPWKQLSHITGMCRVDGFNGITYVTHTVE